MMISQGELKNINVKESQRARKGESNLTVPSHPRQERRVPPLPPLKPCIETTPQLCPGECWRRIYHSSAKRKSHVNVSAWVPESTNTLRDKAFCVFHQIYDHSTQSCHRITEQIHRAVLHHQ